MPESVSKEPLVWIDCEVRDSHAPRITQTNTNNQMTGLDYENDSIMSIACFVTDYDLNLLESAGLEIFIHHSQERLDQMGDWCKAHHSKSGLSNACLESNTSAEEAATNLLNYVQRLVPDRRKALLAGNSVHADRMFLAKPPYKPVLQHLHHRLLDVSAIKEAARRWAPAEILKKGPQKAGKHEAKADILESIEEARFYRQAFFKASTEYQE